MMKHHPQTHIPYPVYTNTVDVLARCPANANPLAMALSLGGEIDPSPEHQPHGWKVTFADGSSTVVYAHH